MANYRHRLYKTVLNEFQSYLTIEYIYSDVKAVYSGIPQGGILWPLLFLAYIKYMSMCCPGINLVHFADDTTVWRSGWTWTRCTNRWIANAWRWIVGWAVTSCPSTLIRLSKWLFVIRIWISVIAVLSEGFLYLWLTIKWAL